MKKLGETAQAFMLQPRRRYQVEMAFVDRRLLLAVDGRLWLGARLAGGKKSRRGGAPFKRGPTA